MSNKSKNKGDAAEREIAEILSRETGLEIRRKLGAGRQDDEGDLEGLPNHVLQVANWADTARAAREKTKGAEQQRENAKVDYAASLIRFRGGKWVVCLSIEQWLRYVKLVVHTFNMTSKS